MTHNRIITGDAREVLQDLEPCSVQTCVTSPPYFGLRDYGHHGQIGLERTPEAFVQELVEVFREVRRVLRDDGTLWLNLGDSYNAYNGNGGASTGSANRKHHEIMPELPGGTGLTVTSLKNKDLIGIPWRVAFSLQADGWYLRQDIIWHKPNPMPESVKDRCTKAHEYIFLLSKNTRYYFDAETIKQKSTEAQRPQRRRAVEIAHAAGLTQAHFDAIRACGATDAGKNQITQNGYMKNAPEVQRLAREAKNVLGGYYREFTFSEKKNKRSVWSIPASPYKGAHFATFPPALVEPCVLAGCPEGGVVLDPFFGAGTTGLVAAEHGRHFIGIELNPDYTMLATQRLTEAGVKL